MMWIGNGARGGLIIAAVAATLLPSSGGARPLGVGFYAPELTGDPYKRFAYVQRIAHRLSSALGQQVQGIAYKRAGHLQQDIRNNKIQFAVLGGFHLAAYRKGKILATGRLAAGRVTRWTLMCKKKRPLHALRGQILQLPNLGQIVFGLVENGLLGGNLKIRRHFRVRLSPDETSAEAAVRIGTAAVVFAPVTAKGLSPLIDKSLPVPPPSFVQLARDLPAEQTRKAQATLLGTRSSLGILKGWGAASPAVYQRLAAQAKGRRLRMVLIPARMPRPRVRALINRDAVQYEYPDLSRLFTVP